MTPPFDPARRTFLTAVAGLTALAVLPGDSVTRLGSIASLSPLDALLRRIRATRGATGIAESWIARQSGASTDPDELRAALTREIGPNGEQLSTAITNDFANGRMALHDGWPVAETEARLCALAHLAQA